MDTQASPSSPSSSSTTPAHASGVRRSSAPRKFSVAEHHRRTAPPMSKDCWKEDIPIPHPTLHKETDKTSPQKYNVGQKQEKHGWAKAEKTVWSKNLKNTLDVYYFGTWLGGAGPARAQSRAWAGLGPVRPSARAGPAPTRVQNYLFPNGPK